MRGRYWTLRAVPEGDVCPGGDGEEAKGDVLGGCNGLSSVWRSIE